MRITRKTGGGLAALVLGLALATVPTQAQAAIPCDVAALQAAIVAANGTGGSIDLAPNCTYSVTDAQAIGDNAMPVIVNDITLKGANSTIERAATAVTLFRIFEIDGPSGKLTLNNVTLRNGHAPVNGGGVLVNSEGTLTLNTNAVVKENVATVNGGGIQNDDGHVFLNSGSKITTNEAIGGGGIFSEGEVTAQSTNVSGNTALDSGGGILNNVNGFLTLRSSVVSGNTATTEEGGGVWNGDPRTTFTNTVISGNTAGNSGGGLSNHGRATFTSGRISDNNAANRGGGVNNTAQLNLNLTVLMANHVTVPALTSHGGGLYNESSTATLTRSNVYQNTVAPPGDGGGIYEQPGSTVNLVQSSVFNNSPDNCRPPGAVPGCVG
ncbi:hypothetical protein [Streptomyces sp. NPDC005322]|uniref:hypothetical protein n=1 Tax=Streptomyces sp. NPDC005322 TaxID=3157032 RepID=UPI0033BB48EC